MIKTLLVSFLVFSWSTGSQHESDNTLAAHSAYKIAIKRIIAKREINCESDQHLAADGKTCCKKCPPGTFKKHDCTTGNNTTCSPCNNGLTFMDEYNYVEKCRRCQPCDSGHGLEVENNCTTTHNTKCRCKSGYFCVSEQCTKHCEPCDKCENGIVDVHCTPTSNTVCKGNFWWMLSALILLLPLAGILYYCLQHRKNYKNLNVNQQYSNNVIGEENPLLYTDIDLSPHISSIAEGMTLPQVKTFVRRHQITEPTIERVIQDNQNDTAEQKIKLLLNWYEAHGMKGAHRTLISSLRELKMCAVADSIEEKLKAAVSSSQENNKSNNGTTEQSSVHSYGDSVP
ncbi:tumor necrosis factor receptor superfamily member 6 [Alligator mississippiensis]|uniref:tumor necrosis factor receptor superfamily member 6 n=1 Tax=Alligator mississippiensis TaxID=8496 RepID=UPI0028778C67|nr:tumor necrosis factor receptor superfamily member 6 [Alligator mississippiensis]